jgi:hypothetical protein
MAQTPQGGVREKYFPYFCGFGILFPVEKEANPAPTRDNHLGWWRVEPYSHIMIPLLPEAEYWFSGTPLFVAGSFILAIILALRAIRDMQSPLATKVLAGFAVVLMFLGWASTARQEKENAGLKLAVDRLLNGGSEKPLADAQAQFVHPQLPAIMVFSLTDVTATNVLYSIILWNLDSPENELDQPLHIPTQRMDFIPKHSFGGLPNAIFDRSDVLSRLRDGDRLFGYTVVWCLDCKFKRQYWLFIKWREGGWFHEMDNSKNINIEEIRKALPQIAKSFDDFANNVAPFNRKPILTWEELHRTFNLF